MVEQNKAWGVLRAMGALLLPVVAMLLATGCTAAAGSSLLVRDLNLGQEIAAAVAAAAAAAAAAVAKGPVGQ